MLGAPHVVFSSCSREVGITASRATTLGAREKYVIGTGIVMPIRAMVIALKLLGTQAIYLREVTARPAELQ